MLYPPPLRFPYVHLRSVHPGAVYVKFRSQRKGSQALGRVIRVPKEGFSRSGPLWAESLRTFCTFRRLERWVMLYRALLRRRPEPWILDVGSWILDPGSWMPDPGSRMLDPGGLDPGSWSLEACILEPGSCSGP